MSVESVKELWPGRKGEDGIERKRTYTRVFEVRTTDPADDPTVAGGDPALPRNGDPYPSDGAALMVSIVPTNTEEDPTLWRVECNYSTELPGRAESRNTPAGRESQVLAPDGSSQPALRPPGTREEDPLIRPVTWRYGYEQVAEVVRQTRFGAAIVNSAKDPFDPPLTQEVSRPVITFTRNVAGVNVQTLDEYEDTVNFAEWRGYAPGTAKLNVESVEPTVEGGVSFIRVVMRVKIKREGWQPKVIDAGKARLVPAAGTDPARREEFRHPKTGELLTDPQLLDGSGQKLAAGLAPVFLDFQTYRTANWSSLGI